MKSKLIKLTKGITLFSTFQLYDKYIGIDGLHKIAKAIEVFLSFLPKALAFIIANLFEVVICMGLIYCAVSGLFRICTFHQHLRTFED